MDWKINFNEGKKLVLGTCSRNCVPNCNVVISLGFLKNKTSEPLKLLIADCQMAQTLKNIKETKKICVVSKYMRIKGTAKIYSSGEYFELCRKKTKEYEVKNAIVIEVEEVFDLDKLKKIY